MVELSSEQLVVAQAAWQVAYDRLTAHHRAVDLREKRALLGRCFKHTETLRDDPDTAWLVYIAVAEVDELDTQRLTGWHFQRVPTGQIEIMDDADLRPGFLSEQCIEITRAEFITAFNELLTAIARFAHRVLVK